MGIELIFYVWLIYCSDLIVFLHFGRSTLLCIENTWIVFKCANKWKLRQSLMDVNDIAEERADIELYTIDLTILWEY